MRFPSRVFPFLFGLLVVLGLQSAAAQVDLRLGSSLSDPEIQSDGAATSTATVVLENAGSIDTTDVTVDVTVPSELSVQSSATTAGSYGSGSWSGIDVPVGTKDTLDLTVTLSSEAPQDLSAVLSGDAGTSTSARIVPVPYGSRDALSFDGSGDYLDLPDGVLSQTVGTIEHWVYWDGSGSEILLYSSNDAAGDGFGGASISYEQHTAINSGEFVFAYDDNNIKDNFKADTTLQKGRWYHLAVTYDLVDSKTIKFYVDGELSGTVSVSESPTDRAPTVTRLGRPATFERFFSGTIDLVRTWNEVRTQKEIQRSKNQTLSGTSSGLVATYRADTGGGSVAYDVGRTDSTYSDGTFQGDLQWVDPSGASIGRQSTVLTEATSPVTVGPSGSSIQGTLISGSGLSSSATVYRWGRESDTLVTDESFPTGVSDRSNVAWGLWSHGSAEVSATLSYGDVSGLTTDGSKPVLLLRRPAADTAWTNVTDSANVTPDTGADQFSIDGVTGRYQYAVANAEDDVDLVLDSSRTEVEIRPDGTAETTITLTLSHVGGIVDATGVTVDVRLPSGLSVTGSSPSSGTYGSGTWDVGAVAEGESETLDLSVTLSTSVVQDVDAQLSSLDQTDSDSASTNARIAPVPYGSGQALKFDGSGDYLDLPTAAIPLKIGTIEHWVYWTDDGGILLYGSKNGGNGYGGDFTDLEIHTAVKSSGKFVFAYHDGNISNNFDSDTTLKSGQWYHLAVSYDLTGSQKVKFYVNGALDTTRSVSSSPSDLSPTNAYLGRPESSTRYFDGRVDLVRTWTDVLSQQEVQTRAHRTMDLDSTAVAGSLIASYRFDAGSGTTAYDVASFDTLYSDGELKSAQWASFSGAPLGRESTTLANGETATLGPSGGSVSVSGVSTTSGDADSDTLQVYQYGRTDGPTVTSSAAGEDFSQIGDDVNKRLHVVWGFGEIGGVSADVTLDYSNVQGLMAPENVRLLKRDGPGQPWKNVSDSSWTWNSAAQTFHRDSLTAFSQYAIGEASSALPVELAGFEGTTTEDGVRLSWTTASETGNARFAIQRRKAGPPTATDPSSTEDWQTVGSVEGAGTTDEPQSYQFTDADLPYAADTLTYRLKQIDTDGSVGYSDPITIDRGAVEQLQLLGTYPNPVRSQATIRFAIPADAKAPGSSPGRRVTMQLYDVLGRRVQTVWAKAEPGRHQLTMEVSDLASGVYFLRLRAGEKVETRKLTVLR